ncbi:zinc finger protein 436-like isoform X6 [Elgaria multicarinata webbii]|uniref:zinc finger protein 436-like isoform X6 n=1 Tax=Elgaria multicarinata webbii TaxID=159646 RepID=UPI002FCD6475
MAKQNLAGLETGRGPDTIQTESTGEFWETTGLKDQSEDTVILDMQFQRFRQLHYQAAEGPRGICNQLHNLSHRWLKPERHTKNQIMDLVILEQFLTILPAEMASWVRECGAETSCQAVALAEGFLLSQAEDQRQQEQQQVQSLFAEAVPDFPAAAKAPSETRESPPQEGDQDASLEGDRMMPEMSARTSLLLCDEVEPDQDLVTFEEIAVWFTDEEWELLDPDQRALHSQITEENCEIMASFERDCWEVENEIDAWEMLPKREGYKHSKQQRSEDGADWNTRNNSFPFQGNSSHDIIIQEQIQENNMLSIRMETFSTESNAHYNIATLKKPYKCKECGKSFRCMSHLLAHQRIHTGEKPYKCLECGRNFVGKGTLTRHQRTHTGEKPYPCLECGKSFSEKETLIRHKRIHTGERPYHCLECGQSFSQKIHLTSHQITHTGEKPYKCLECGQCFSHKKSLTYHQRTHRGDKPYKCLECEKNFSDKVTLIQHKRAHIGEILYHCLECGKNFSAKSRLTTHQRTHTGEKPYNCLECGKSFRQKITLIRHERTHSGEKPYNCLECGKSFNRKEYLASHQRTHTGEKPFHCLECGKSFTQKRNLTLHQRFHSGSKPSEFSEDGESFSRNEHFGSHQRNHPERSVKTLWSVEENVIFHLTSDTGEKP